MKTPNVHELIRKRVDLSKSVVLFADTCQPESLARNWIVKGGEWSIRDGWLVGKNPWNNPGMIISQADYPEDVILQFEAKTIGPSTHDIDFMWNGSWDDGKEQRGTAYVAGLEGWWDGKVGFEKSPEYSLNVASQLFSFEAGRTYLIQAGSIAGHVFVIIDGVLALEITDPDPIDPRLHGKIGFEAYSSWIAVRNIAVLRPNWEPTAKTYSAEF